MTQTPTVLHVNVIKRNIYGSPALELLVNAEGKLIVKLINLVPRLRHGDFQNINPDLESYLQNISCSDWMLTVNAVIVTVENKC